MSVTPQQVEKRLLELSAEIDEAHLHLSNAEIDYNKAKAQYEIAMAKSRMTHRANGKITASQCEDMSLIDNEKAHYELATIEAVVKASRSNMQRIRTQVDIARSISVSVRASMEII